MGLLSAAEHASFRENGFLVVDVLRPHELAPVRAAFERLVEKQRAAWGADAAAAGRRSQWQVGAQPRVMNYDQLVEDTDTARTVELLFDPRTMGVCSELMGGAEAGCACYMLMCSPTEDHGPANWHRDIHPHDQAPLAALREDMRANGPALLQWNLALYDDDVLWVLPGSHRRPNTDAENAALTANDRAVISPEAMQVKLKAGQGVLYTNTNLHWRSNYSPKLRRCVHFGYRSMRGSTFPYVAYDAYGTAATRRAVDKHLSPEIQAVRARHEALWEWECDTILQLYRAMIARDQGGFTSALEALHPAPEHRITAVILLKNLAQKIYLEYHLDGEKGGGNNDFNQDERIAPALSQAERAALWERFLPLHEQLQTEEEGEGGVHYTPGFQSGPSRFLFDEMPAGLTVETFVRTWAETTTAGGDLLSGNARL